MCWHENILFACGWFEKNSWIECSHKEPSASPNECSFEIHDFMLYRKGSLKCDMHFSEEIIRQEKDQIYFCALQGTAYSPDMRLSEADQNVLLKKYKALREGIKLKAEQDIAQARSKNTKRTISISACYGYLRNIGHRKSASWRNLEEDQIALLENVAPLATSHRSERRSRPNCK